MAPALSIVMPAHNEAELLEEAVTAVLKALNGARERSRSFEVIIVENGSTDGTARLAEGIAGRHAEVRALSLPEPDYGRALRAGFLAARGDVVFNFDVDYIDLEFVDRALAVGGDGAGPAVVVGSKRSPGARDTRSWGRRVVTAVFSTVLRVGFGLEVSDTHGMKMLRRAPLEPIVRGCRFGRDLFDTELVLRAQRAGLATAEIPVAVEERRPSRSPIVKRIPRTVWGLARLRWALWREGRR